VDPADGHTAETTDQVTAAAQRLADQCLDTAVEDDTCCCCADDPGNEELPTKVVIIE
jgi:hypothetical protein